MLSEKRLSSMFEPSIIADALFELEKLDYKITNNQPTKLELSSEPHFPCALDLHAAVCSNDPEAVGTLADSDSDSGLFSACALGHAAATEMLLVRNNFSQESLESAILAAISLNHVHILDTLVPHICNGDFKSSLLIKAAESGHLDVVRHFFSHCEIDFVNESSHCALGQAAFFSHVPIVKFLLDKNANTQICDRNGLTPLQIAVKKLKNNTEITQLKAQLDTVILLQDANCDAQTLQLISKAKAELLMYTRKTYSKVEATVEWLKVVFSSNELAQLHNSLQDLL